MEEAKKEKIVLDDLHKIVLKMFLTDKKSIREISDILGLGRTKISNMLELCAASDEEIEKQIDLRKLNLRTHKNAEDASEIDLTPLDETVIVKAYTEIIEGGKTLTDVAKEVGKQRDTVKKAIIDYLSGDKDAIREFNQVLKDNQAHAKEGKYFSKASDKEKKKMIFDRLNLRRSLAGKNTYPDETLEIRFRRLEEYFEKRNTRMENPEDRITKEQFYHMAYDCPTILALSLSDKIRPIVGKLDEKYLGEANTSKVLRENPGIVGTTLTRIRLQIRILKDSETLNKALEKPRIFRTSPELLYAQIKHWKEVRPSVSTPFMCRHRLEEIYRKTPEEIQAIHDIRDEYGDDEYFDGR